MNADGQREVRERITDWVQARTTIVKRQDFSRVGLTPAPKQKAQMEEFVAQLNRCSQALVNTLGIHDPVLFEALCELVNNARTLVNEQHARRN